MGEEVERRLDALGGDALLGGRLHGKAVLTAGS
ncbi:hypothetical protein ATKI12_2797 [Kitasatospora sp. Ki12]